MTRNKPNKPSTGHIGIGVGTNSRGGSGTVVIMMGVGVGGICVATTVGGSVTVLVIVEVGVLVVVEVAAIGIKIVPVARPHNLWVSQTSASTGYSPTGAKVPSTKRRSQNTGSGIPSKSNFKTFLLHRFCGSRIVTVTLSIGYVFCVTFRTPASHIHQRSVRETIGGKTVKVGREVNVGIGVKVGAAVDVKDGGSRVRVGLNVAVEGSVWVIVGVLVGSGVEVWVGVRV